MAREGMSAMRNGATRNLYAAATPPHPAARASEFATRGGATRGDVPTPQPCAPRYVANVAEGVREAQVTAIFAKYGDLESIRLVPKKRAAFINFASIGVAAWSK